MPSCRVTNHTNRPLNICLKQVTALHFENGVGLAPYDMSPPIPVKLTPGRTWSDDQIQTHSQALVDDETKKTRYSVLKSAATIAVLSIAVGAVAATAGAALLPEVAAVEAAAAAGVVGTYLAKGASLTKAALIKNSGSIAKLSLPKAIDRLSAEFGGLTALQREVLSIVASPTLSSDVRHKATSLLRQLSSAYSNDKAKRKEAHPVGATLTPLTDEEAEKLEKEIENGTVDDKVENTTIMTGNVLRVHGIYMNQRREFQIRTGVDGRLELWDAISGQRW